MAAPRCSPPAQSLKVKYECSYLKYEETKQCNFGYMHVYLLAVAAFRAFLLASSLAAVALVALAAFLARVWRLLLFDGAAAAGLGAQDDVHALHVVGAVRLVLVHLGR